MFWLAVTLGFASLLPMDDNPCNGRYSPSCTNVSSSGSVVSGEISLPGFVGSGPVVSDVVSGPPPPVSVGPLDRAVLIADAVLRGLRGDSDSSVGEWEKAARSVVTKLHLPSAPLKIGPDPSANEWGTAFVGFPLWLWVDVSQVQSATIEVDGVSLTMTAEPGVLRVDMGDGSVVRCVSSTPYTSGVVPGSPSPTCGYVYTKPGAYTITSSVEWTVRWSSSGRSGSFVVPVTTQRAIVVDELVSTLR